MTNMCRRVGLGRVFIAGVLLAAVIAIVFWQSLATPTVAAVLFREKHPQTSWAACNRNAHNRAPSTFKSLSDQAAASLVTHEPETRPYNARSYTLNGVRYPAANDYVPSTAEIARFRRSKTSAGQPVVQFNPYDQYVDGRDGIPHPSTDDLIQWAAHKWGIPEDWLRAEYVHESYWNQYMLGDATPVSGSSYNRYPSQSRIAHTSEVYQSLGITQVRWAPDGSLNAGSEPLRWLSTAFNIDEQVATLRFYYDNPSGSRTAWNDASYRPCQMWNSVGGWFRPYPWNSGDQQTYARDVQQIVAQRGWNSSSFLGWSPSSLPAGIRFR